MSKANTMNKTTPTDPPMPPAPLGPHAHPAQASARRSSAGLWALLALACLAGCNEHPRPGANGLPRWWFQPVAGRRHAPGARLRGSTLGGPQEEARFEIRLFEGRWWVGYNSDWLGSYDASLFPLMKTGACSAAWYGEVFDPTPVHWTTTGMGSGRFADQGYGNVSWVSNPVIYKDASGFWTSPVSVSAGFGASVGAAKKGSAVAVRAARDAPKGHPGGGSSCSRCPRMAPSPLRHGCPGGALRVRLAAAASATMRAVRSPLTILAASLAIASLGCVATFEEGRPCGDGCHAEGSTFSMGTTLGGGPRRDAYVR
jgi:Neprosin